MAARVTHHFARLEDPQLDRILRLDPDAASLDQLKLYVSEVQSIISDALETW